jgi:hypothetical protein
LENTHFAVCLSAQRDNNAPTRPTATMSAAPTILRVDSGLEQCSQTGLLEGIRRGLLQPSVPLSAAAAAKLQQQQQQQSSETREGQLLRSLPVELLYDSTGLALFDQVRLNRAILCHPC